MEFLLNGNNIYLFLAAITCLVLIIFLIYSFTKNNEFNRKKIKKQLELMNNDTKIEKKSELENVLQKMEEDLNKAPSIATFEESQEEKAIISYNELINTAKLNLTEIKEEKDHLDNLSFDINDIYEEGIEELVDLIEEPKENITIEIPSIVVETPLEQVNLIEEVDLISKIDEVMKPLEATIPPSKFQNSDFISPIYGKLNKQDNTLEVNYEQVDIPTNSINMNKVAYINDITNTSSEQMDNEEFLKNLMDLKNNLK
ncbi:MAG: hypothetical protein R3Y21_02585 [Mycoplasmatota bacterium]